MLTTIVSPVFHYCSLIVLLLFTLKILTIFSIDFKFYDNWKTKVNSIVNLGFWLATTIEFYLVFERTKIEKQ